MAESLLFSLAESFIRKLASRAVEETSLALGVYNHLREIKDTVSLIKAVLLDAEQKQWHNHELREWLRQIKYVFSKAEDVIDDFECEALRKRVVNSSGTINTRKVRRFFSSSSPLVYRVKMAHKIKHIKERFDKVASDRFKFGLQINYSDDNRVVKRREVLTHSHVIDSDVIGRDYDKQKIIDLLLQHSGGGDKTVSVIPIVGIGGLGKTTLAKTVFNDKRVDESFSLKIWVSVSDDFELQHLLVKILNSASVSDSATNFRNLDVEQLQRFLRNTLGGKKFLLVLDDVWNEDRVKWVELNNLIQYGGEGSKVLVTTRSHTIAKMMSTSTSYILQGLSSDDSLSVFVNWAFRKGEDRNYPDLMEIGKEIVQKCGGLPLALRTLGSSLFLKGNIQEWKFVRDNELWNLPQNEGSILPAIKLSYDQLPSYLRQCFSCFCLFEKDFHFSNIHLTGFWEALGFLPPPNRGETVEDVSTRILHELWSRSFLQNFVVLGGSCEFKLHDLVHDLALYVSKHEFQLVKFRDENILENVLHLSFFKNDLLGQTPIPTRLRTIIFPIEANNEAFLNTLTSRCKFLRILKLRDSTYESLPSSIGRLKHLRYLNLARNKELKSIPDSICKLQNLITLKLGGCTKLEVLPDGIGNLISLRQLSITTKQSNLPNKEISKLKYLELLSISCCDNLESLFQGIQLPNLKLLDISLCKNLKSLPLHAFVNIETLLIDNCDKLNLSFDHDNETFNLRLKSLFLDSLPQLVSMPQWMRRCADTLHSLTIDNCENLYEVHEWSSTLVYLNILLIRNCSKLVSLTDDTNTRFLPNLEMLVIAGSPELLGRYQPGVGSDWHMISHIKEVYIE